MKTDSRGLSRNLAFLQLKIEDFADLFGTSVDDFSKNCRHLIEKTDFTYKKLEGIERDKVILEVCEKIESDQQVIGASERYRSWQNGWGENLREFIESGYNLRKLTPKFIRPNRILRLRQDYILPNNSYFELDFLSILRLWLFEKYFGNFDSIYEFGCGTGFNLVALAQLYPNKSLCGLDFVNSSVELVNEIGRAYNWNIAGLPFDMLSPDGNLHIEKDTAIFTFGSIEQLASKFEAFLQFLLNQPPAICLHIEPIIELYEEDNFIDYLAIKFHKKRGYTENFLPSLRDLEKQGKIEILNVKRSFFGSLYMEGYSMIIWRPKI